ncbi:MAG: hypothetical protein R2850_11170 [Bacteroidia bacterium]
MKQIAAFINNGLQSGVYYTGLSGFDTHVRQAETQERLLKVVGDTLLQFRNGPAKNREMEKYIGYGVFEFGRRVNRMQVTALDHGTANQVYLLGGSLKNAGFRNEAGSLSDLDDGDLKHHMDFRNIYASVLDRFIEFDSSLVLSRKFENLDFI